MLVKHSEERAVALMAKGLLVNYEYCTGCHSCEVACKKHLKLSEGQFGIKVSEVGPFRIAKGQGPEAWEWSWVPSITKLCDGCCDRVSAGKMPMCVQHCQAWCIQYGDIDELVSRIDGQTRYSLLTLRERGLA